MDRLDNTLDHDTIIKILQRHPCNIPRADKQRMQEIKKRFDNIADRIRTYSECLGGSFSSCEKVYITFHVAIKNVSVG